MILEQDVTLLICGEISDASLQTNLFSNRNIFRQADCFAEYTIALIRKSDLHKLRDCFRVADRLLQGGCATVKMAVTNVFMYTVGIELDRLTNGLDTIKQVMTPELVNVYHRQLSNNGV